MAPTALRCRRCQRWRNGVDGKNGVNGKDGVTTIIREQVAGEQSKLLGATVRTLTVPKLKGGKLVSVKATLRGKKLAVSGRTIKVDLTGKPVGNYNVTMIAKFKKDGKIRTVRQHAQPERHARQVVTNDGTAGWLRPARLGDRPEP